MRTKGSMPVPAPGKLKGKKPKASDRRQTNCAACMTRGDLLDSAIWQKKLFDGLAATVYALLQRTPGAGASFGCGRRFFFFDFILVVFIAARSLRSTLKLTQRGTGSDLRLYINPNCLGPGGETARAATGDEVKVAAQPAPVRNK